MNKDLTVLDRKHTEPFPSAIELHGWTVQANSAERRYKRMIQGMACKQASNEYHSLKTMLAGIGVVCIEIVQNSSITARTLASL